MARPRLTAEAYIEGIRQGERTILARGLTLLESKRAEDTTLASEVLTALWPAAYQTGFRIAVTGPPGAGKSTLIEELGMAAIASGRNVAVLAIDPSSGVSQGSILADKTRMDRLSQAERAYVRPTPAGRHLGGTAEATRECLALVQAAGFDLVLIETVGVGQSEIEVAAMADMVLLALAPAAGDELQGVKRGIVEVADVVAITKAEGELAPLAMQAALSYRQGLHLAPPKESGWAVPVLEVSSLAGTGIAALWETLGAYHTHILSNGYFGRQRKAQLENWLAAKIKQTWESRLFENSDYPGALIKAKQAVETGGWVPTIAQNLVAEVLKVG
jgi:LAO/AO transport system kinase